MTIKMVECEECGGTGQVESECPTCGHTEEDDCEMCGGSGEVEGEESEPEEKEKEEEDEQETDGGVI